MRWLLTIFSVVVLSFSPSWAGGSREAAGSSSGSGKYLAERGIIVEPKDVLVDSYIAAIDYHYPKPGSGIGVTFYTGHQQVSAAGQEEIIHIGIQAPQTEFADLPPMNLVFVIDRSGSMQENDKLDWVKKAFDVFIRRVRDIDYVALVTFNSTASVRFSSTRMDSSEKRARFRDAVWSLTPEDGTNLLEGLRTGYEQVMTNYRRDYTNRILFLTDGNDNQDHSRQILDMARSYRDAGINVSTVGVGASFDLKLMNDLAAVGGGSSRFISDMKQMEQMFGSELDRTIVPAAREVRMTLELASGVDVVETWGYENAVRGRTITYYLPTLHQRDFETILVQTHLQPFKGSGTRELGRFSLIYQDLEGATHSQGPYPIEVESVPYAAPVSGFSDAMVLRSGTMLRFAKTLIRIGELYHGKNDQDTKQTCLSIASAMKKELVNAKLRLDDKGFDDEIGMMDSYIKVLGASLAMRDEETVRISKDEEIAPPEPQRSLDDNLGNLFHEVLLEMKTKADATIAVSGFTMKKEKPPQIVSLLNERGLLELTKVPQLKVVERERLDSVMQEQKLSLSDLMDTEKAIEVGRVLSARYILTGSVIEMPSSVVIFTRIVNSETAEVESAAQVIVAKTPDVAALL